MGGFDVLFIGGIGIVVPGLGAVRIGVCGIVGFRCDAEEDPLTQAQHRSAGAVDLPADDIVRR